MGAAVTCTKRAQCAFFTRSLTTRSAGVYHLHMKYSKLTASTLASLLVTVLASGCGGSDAGGEVPPGDNTAYTSDPVKTVVVGGAAASTPAGAQSGTGCVTLPSGQCVEAKSCGAGERRDVVVDSAGKVVAVVCYPADSTPTVIDAQGNVDLGKTENGGVVAVDGAADGVDITGNVTAAGNNVTVYGHGPDVSVIGGNVTATGNNFAMRGVTVQGNVQISGGNNATLVLCVVQGDVHITGNNNVIANCDVLGNIIIEGVNNTLVGNHVGGTITIADAKNQVCDGNLKWTDGNGNKAFDAGEAGAALTCSSVVVPKK